MAEHLVNQKVFLNPVFNLCIGVNLFQVAVADTSITENMVGVTRIIGQC